MHHAPGYPQDYPDHLHTHARVDPQHATPPNGFRPLQFERMAGDTFEQLCWWLLQKDHTLVGCQRLGDKGRVSQQGIDLFAFDRWQPERLQVFECKCRGRFGPSDLNMTVAGFLAGEWADVASRFTLVLAQSGIGALDTAWVKARAALAARGIEADLWTAEHLTERLKDAPDVLTRFFSGVDIELYCNQWQQKVALDERLLKAHADPRRAVSGPAQAFLASGVMDDAALTRRYVEGRHWHLRQPWIDISGLLPTAQDYPGSALVTLRMPDTAGVMVSLDHCWLLQHFLGNDGEPLSPQARPFFQGVASLPGADHIIDLKNCRFFMPAEGAQAVARAADEFSQAYLHNLREVDRQWQAEGFPLVRWLGVRVALCKVGLDTWRQMLDFANAHDTENGDSPWHLFHAAPDRLMPTSRSGYHGVFYGAQVAGLCHGGEIAILWEPNPDRHRPADHSGWSCRESHDWLVNDLLPAIGRWQARWIAAYWRNWLRPWRTRRAMQAAREHWRRADIFTDLHRQPLLEASHFRSIGLRELLLTLQSFHASTPSNRACFTATQKAGLYEALALLLQAERGYLGYLCGNLGVQPSCTNHADLRKAVETLRQRTLAEDPEVNIDYTFRAMLEALGDDESGLSPSMRERLFELLTPFMATHDRQLLIARHTEYL